LRLWPRAAGDTLTRKFGRSEAMQKHSVPELVFAYFNNKYGQRALVDENIGSLVNTLTLYQRSDLRLEAFARWAAGSAGGCLAWHSCCQASAQGHRSSLAFAGWLLLLATHWAAAGLVPVLSIWMHVQQAQPA
jgi:hypothetical protein